MGLSALALAALAVVCMLVGPWGAVASLVASEELAAKACTALASSRPITSVRKF